MFAILTIGVALTTQAQPVFQNPSFEGNPASGTVPPNWFMCSGSPDVQPGFWGTTQTPSDGNTYLGFHHTESVSANFTNGLGACSQLNFNMDVSIVPLNLPGNQFWVDNNQGVNDGYICIYGGYTNCDNQELLWQSPLITNVSTWQTLSIQLNPSQNYTYLNFVPCINNAGTYTYFGIDNIVVTDQLAFVDPLQDQTLCESDDIAINPSGNYSANATFQWTGPNGFSSTDENVLISNSTLADDGQYTLTVTDGSCTGDPVNVNVTIVDCTPNLSCNLLCNTDFEDQQVTSPGSYTIVNQSNVPCWSTTASDQMVEVWGTGFNGVPAYSGSQFIELNANLVSTLYQDFQALPGSTVDISFAHRGRAGTDVMSVSVGPIGGPYVNLGTFSTGNTAWQYYTVSYTFPPIPQVNYSLRFNSISAAGGSQGVGNFLDDISITMPQLVVNETVTDPSCTMLSDGEIDVAISGGTPPYSISWDAPLNATTTSVTDLAEGQYTYHITDLYGCEYTDVVTLTAQHSEEQSSSTETICQGEQFVLPSGISLSTAGTYVDTLSTIYGCDSIVTTQLNVNPVFSSNQSVSICDGTTYTLPGGMTVSTGGTYSDTLQTTLGCDSIINTDLTVNPSPVVNLSVSICSGQSYLAEGSQQTQTGIYHDTLSTSFGCDSVIITDLTVLPLIVHTIDTAVCVGDSILTGGTWKSQVGSYNDSLVTPNGCDSLLITNLSFYAQPAAGINLSNSCLDAPLTIYDASTIPSGTLSGWSWNLGNGNVSSLQQPLPQSYPAAGNYTVSLIVTSDNGCIDSTQESVEIYPLPIALFTWDSVCHQTANQFTDLSTAVGSYPLTQWSWVFSSGQTSTLQNPTITFNQPGTYDATLTVTTSVGCKADTSLGSALVYPNPVAVIEPISGHCLNDEIQLLESSTIDNTWGDSIISWDWLMEPSVSSSDQEPTHVFATSGMHSVQLSVETANGCTDMTTATVEVYDRPQVALSLSKTEGCEPLTVDYNDESSISSPYSIAQWNWQLGHGETSSESNPSFTHNYQGADGVTPDTLDVSLNTVSSKGCTSVDTAEATIVVYPLPTAAFQSEPSTVNMVDPTVDFIDKSTLNVVLYNWMFGDGQISSLTNPTYTYSDTGSYSVNLHVETAYGCTDATIGEVTVDPYFSFFIPNTFTPNQNGRNDVFKGYGEGYTSVSISIFDRWGERIFYGVDNGAGWDGNYRGAPVEVGVYIYVFLVTDWEGNERRFTGNVNVLR